MWRSDRITIPLAAAALCAAIVGASCLTNARIDDLNANLNARIDDLNANLNARIDDRGPNSRRRSPPSTPASMRCTGKSATWASS